MPDNTSTCQHEYRYLGMRYCNGTRPLSGTGAKRRYYAHVYFCAKCAETRSECIAYPDGITYDRVLWDALPGTPDQCGVPASDR